MKNYLVKALYFAVIAFLFTGCNCPGNPDLEANKRIVKKYIEEVIVDENYELLHEIVDEDFVNELSPKFSAPVGRGVSTTGRKAHLEHLKALHSERNIIVKIQDILAEGNHVAISMLVTHDYVDGRSATFPWFGIYYIEDGKIVRAKHIHDTLLEFLQLNEAKR